MHFIKLSTLLLIFSISQAETNIKLDKNNLSLSLVEDFPSTGDTAFPGIVQLDNNTYLLMNYSSNINGRKKSWIAGQLGKTYIYWTTLRF